MSYCRHDLLLATCAECAPTRRAQDPVLSEREPPSVEVRSAGKCPACGSDYAPGDRLWLVDASWVCCWEGRERDDGRDL